jgi:hypothetical protein
VDVEVGVEEGAEETEALEMVEVQVAEEDVQLLAGRRLHHHAERPDPGAGVEHEHVPAR